MNHASFWALAVTAILITDAFAQQIVYPAKGQSLDQQKSDEAACYSWAVEQTMFDPANPPAQQQAGSQEQQATFGKARAACLEGRGYTVR